MLLASDNPYIVRKVVFHRSGFFDVYIPRMHAESLSFSRGSHLLLTLGNREPRLGARAEKILYGTSALILEEEPLVVA